MPTAVQNCPGSLRLVSVKRHRDDDRADCPFCIERPKSTRRILQGSAESPYWYEIPSHRPNGVRDASKIDWSNV